MLDDLLPHPDFAERHHRWVAATPTTTWAALTAVRLEDLTITRPLVALRHLRSAPPRGPLLTDGPVTLLTRDDGATRAVAGAVGRPWRPRAPRREVGSLAAFTAFDEPGWTKYLTEFRVEPDGRGAVLVTETRGVSTDAAARRRFRLYWWLIRIPSGLIRRDVLRTVARAATRADGTTPTAAAERTAPVRR